MFVVSLAVLCMKAWPTGTFRGIVSKGIVQQHVTVDTNETFGVGRVKLRGFVNVNDDFVLNDSRITMGTKLTNELEKFGVNIIDFIIDEQGGSVSLSVGPFGTLNVSLT